MVKSTLFKEIKPDIGPAGPIEMALSSKANPTLLNIDEKKPRTKSS
jgi:hypothetical protein